MAARAYWKGYLKLSLVSCPIQLFPAISAREKISFHQINRKTGNRIKYCKLDAVTGEPVSDEEIVKGYEVSKGRYVEITDDELEAGAVGQQAFAVINGAIKKKDMVALGHVVLTTREHVIAVEPRGKGMLGVTLRYPYEIRKAADYFDEIPDGKVPKDMLDLAVHLVETKAGHFEPEQFEAHYENALKQLIKKKQRGEKIEKPKERPSAQVINLMEALRQSATA